MKGGSFADTELEIVRCVFHDLHYERLVETTLAAGSVGGTLVAPLERSRFGQRALLFLFLRKRLELDGAEVR